MEERPKKRTNENQNKPNANSFEDILNERISRRKAIGTGAAVAAVAAGIIVAGAGGYYAGTSTAPSASTRTVTSTVTQSGGGGTTQTVTQTVTSTVTASQTSSSSASQSSTITTGQSGGQIKIGLLTDLTGGLAPIGVPQGNATTLAIEQINAAGGIAGGKIQLIIEDSASDLTVSTEKATKLITQDKVNMLAGGITSASREAIRPIADQAGTPYIYTTWYEGGVCDLYNIIPAEVPNQIWVPLLDYGFSKLGPKVYYFGADYNALRALQAIIKGYAPTKGGTVVGSELFPFTTTDFSGLIRRIEDAKPDWMMGGLAGSLGNTFLNQWYAKGDQNTVVPNDHFADISRTEALLAGLDPNFTKGLLNCYSYLAEVGTPENAKFKQAYNTRFPGAVLPDNVGEKMYSAMWLYKGAVETAGTFTDAMAVRNAYVQQTFKAPSGLITMDPDNNHATMDVHIGQSDPSLGGHYKIINTLSQVAPIINGYPFFQGHTDPFKNECLMPKVWNSSNGIQPKYYYAGT